MFSFKNVVIRDFLQLYKIKVAIVPSVSYLYPQFLLSSILLTISLHLYLAVTPTSKVFIVVLECMGKY